MGRKQVRKHRNVKKSASYHKLTKYYVTVYCDKNWVLARLQNLAEQVFTDFESVLPLRKTSKCNFFRRQMWKLTIYSSNCFLCMFLNHFTFFFFFPQKRNQEEDQRGEYYEHFIPLWAKWPEQFFVKQRWWKGKCFFDVEWSQRSKIW